MNYNLYCKPCRNALISAKISNYLEQLRKFEMQQDFIELDTFIWSGCLDSLFRSKCIHQPYVSLLSTTAEKLSAAEEEHVAFSNDVIVTDHFG